MSEKRRALGRGLGALIPSAPHPARPADVFFRDADARSTATDEPSASGVADDWTPTGGEQTGADLESSRGTGTGLAPVPGAVFAELLVASIRPNPKQPRTVFDEDELAELAHSIQEIGVLQPIVVRRVQNDQAVSGGRDTPEADDGPQSQPDASTVAYELIMGERRLRASQLAGLDTIPAIIKQTQDDALLRDALLENLHRSQLNPLEEAAAYQQLLDDFGCSHEELASRIGRSRPQISNTLRLLRLPPLVARRLAAGVLSAGHARALLGLEDGAAMERLAQRIVAEGLSVRSVEEIVALGGDQAPRVRRPGAGHRHPQLDDVAARLSDRLDTRVSIDLGQRKGRITVEFASVEDLNRIVVLLGEPVADAGREEDTSAQQ